MQIEAVLEQTALVSRWQALAADPHTPDYYELNEYGELITPPRPTNDHQRTLSAVVVRLQVQLGPEAAAEISVLTDRGIRVPDVVWMPQQRWDQVKGKTPIPFAPDICVEVLSPGNTREEMVMKCGAYLRAGAREVIVIGLKGEIEYFDAEGKRAASALGVELELPPSLFQSS